MNMGIHLGRRAVLLVVAGAALLAGGVAYAKVADAGGVLTACRLNSNGSLRLIDPTLSSGPLSRCTENETQVSWNQQGAPGTPGKDGTSPTVAQLAAGDSHCSGGGGSITDAAGHVAYVCNGATGAEGAPGKDGSPFNGTFTSPNGQFTLTVSDQGVSIIGPDSSVSLPSGGGIFIVGGDIQTVANNATTQINHDETTHVGHDRSETVGNDETATVGRDQTRTVGRNEAITISGNRTETVHGNETITIDASRTERVGLNDSLNVSANRTVRAGNQLSLLAGGLASIDGSTAAVNGAGGGCKPAARTGDLVSSTAILTGSATVCIGG